MIDESYCVHYREPVDADTVVVLYDELQQSVYAAHAGCQARYGRELAQTSVARREKGHEA